MGSVGVVLFTSDGGLEWKQQLADTLARPESGSLRRSQDRLPPRRRQRQFPVRRLQDDRRRPTWEPVAGPRTTTWLAGDFYDGKTGILAGGAGAGCADALRKTTCSSARSSAQAERTCRSSRWFAGRDITSVQILGKKTLAVGQGGSDR